MVTRLVEIHCKRWQLSIVFPFRVFKKALKILDKTSTIFGPVKRVQGVPIFIGNYAVGADERVRTVIIKQMHFFLSRRRFVF